MNTNQKKAYNSPRMSVIHFQVQDVITTSGAGGFFGDEDIIIEKPVELVF